MKICDASRHTGISVHTIRYYEKNVLIRSPEKDANGHRQYNSQDIELLSWILCMKNSGMSLNRIKQYSSAFYQGDIKKCLALLQGHEQRLKDQKKAILHYLDVTQIKINKLQKSLT